MHIKPSIIIPKPDFNCLAVTANCGNSSLDEKAITPLSAQLNDHKPSSLILNLQEANLSGSKQTLQTALNQSNAENHTNYKLKTSELMMTRTKMWPLSVLLGQTGLGSLVIYDADKVSATCTSSNQVRRRNNWFIFGSNANKGGITLKNNI